jgi:hypothetical protein
MNKQKQDERECDCGECRLCRAYLLSDDDSNQPCPRCNGGGCGKCEEGE